MSRLIRQWLKRWKDWIGDRDMELAIRAALRKQGYNTGQRIVNFRLVAIERPGWVSIYEFNVEGAKLAERSVELYGVARDDARRSTIVRIYEKIESRDQQRAAWSEGMILAPCLRR